MKTMQEETRAWVRMPSGKQLDLLHPTPFDWEDHDLALGLARTYRWGGHSAWPLPLSVAQHSLSVMLLRRAAAPTTALQDLRELLHDAEEGLLGFDCISVLKPFLGERFRTLSERLEQAIFVRYGLPPWTPEEHALHKHADRLAAASEAVHVAGWSRQEVRDVLKIEFEPVDTDPLLAVYGGAAWEPWPPEVATQRFHQKLKQLLRLAAEQAAQQAAAQVADSAQ